MKFILVYLALVVWIWNGFPENYSIGEKGLVLVPLGLPLVFYFIWKMVGFPVSGKRHEMSYDPDGGFGPGGGGDCDSGGGDGGCDGGD